MTEKKYWYLHTAAMEMQKGSLGGFAACIGDAMTRADTGNLEKLEAAFPDLIAEAHTRIAMRDAMRAEIAQAKGETA